MAYQIPYHRSPGFRPINDLIPGNQEADDPVEFDLVPAWGPDLARVRSIVTASLGLIQEQDWSPEVQKAVIASFESGAPVFTRCVEAVRGLTVPATMAVRAGIIPKLPTKPGTDKPDLEAPTPVLTGRHFAAICGAVPAMALNVAMKIAEISAKAEGDTDPRHFKQPSGSGGTETPAATAGRATPARSTPRRRGTAGKKETAGVN